MELDGEKARVEFSEPGTVTATLTTSGPARPGLRRGDGHGADRCQPAPAVGPSLGLGPHAPHPSQPDQQDDAFRRRHRGAAAAGRGTVAHPRDARRIEECRQRAARRRGQKAFRSVQRLLRIFAADAARPHPQRDRRRQARLQREDRGAQAGDRRPARRRGPAGQRRRAAEADRRCAGGLFQQAEDVLPRAARRAQDRRRDACRARPVVAGGRGDHPYRRNRRLARHRQPADRGRHRRPQGDALRAHQSRPTARRHRQRPVRQDRHDPCRRP